MKQKKKVILGPTVDKKSPDEISEVYALLDIIKAIEIKETKQRKKRTSKCSSL